MPRYIDAEKIKFDLTGLIYIAPTDIRKIGAYFIRQLKDMPIADVVEVVRGKDCKYASPNGLYGCLLERFSAHDQRERLFSEDYCSAAERKENG